MLTEKQRLLGVQSAFQREEFLGPSPPAFSQMAQGFEGVRFGNVEQCPRSAVRRKSPLPLSHLKAERVTGRLLEADDEVAEVTSLRVVGRGC